MEDPKLESAPNWTASARKYTAVYIQEQIKAQESEIKAHELAITYYRRRQNALTVTCRIPPEILAVTFGEVVRMTTVEWNNYSWSSSELRWIPSLTHVCSHWRDVAIATPNLWSNILMYFTGWAQEMLKRSKLAPLTITFQPGPRSFIDRGTTASYTIMTEILSAHLSRIKSINLDFKDATYLTPEQRGEILDLLQRPLGQPLHALQRFVVNFPRPHNIAYDDAVMKILVEASPQLEHLMLTDWSIQWCPLPPFEKLKTFSISYYKEGWMSELLGVLLHMPLLESLSIAGAWEDTPNEYTLLHVPVNLGHLKHFTILSDLASIIFLFDHILFSGLLDIKVTVLLQSYVDPPSLPYKQLLRKANNLVKGIARGLVICTSIQIWKSSDLQGPPSLDEPPTIHFGTTDDYGEITSPHMFSDDFWRSLDLVQLSSLNVKVTSSFSADAWSYFGDLPQLETLRVMGNKHESLLLKAFRRRIVIINKRKANPKATLSCPPFTSLRNLILAYWDLNHLGDAVHKTTARRIADCFKIRASAGLSLELLKLEKCSGVDEDNLARLQKHIKEVHYTRISHE
ncbi:hypothetical protein H0H87_002658 [Tephrocybe sp. NHM501043]|nr:hypothetical protein H0H87_002658 [Tephrocybe sp. NHM501043]